MEHMCAKIENGFLIHDSVLRWRILLGLAQTKSVNTSLLFFRSRIINVVQRVFDRIPLDEVWDAVDELALFKDLAKSLLAQVTQTDQQMNQYTRRNVLFEQVEETSHDICKHARVTFESVKDLIAVQDVCHKRRWEI